MSQERLASVAKRTKTSVAMLGFATAIGFVVSPQPVLAGTASTTFNVSVTIVKQCTVTAPSAIAFGNVGATTLLTTTSQQSQSFSVQCSSGTPYTIQFTSSNDLSAGSSIHQMKGAIGGNTNVVQYTLADTTSGATNILPLGGATSVITATGTGSSQSKSLQATILTPSIAVPPDTYSDTITMAVNY